MKLTHEYTYDVKNRFRYLKWIVAAVFIILVGRLYYLQVVKGAYYRFFSEQNSIKEVIIPAFRGMIFDRNGNVIVDNRPAFDVVAIPQYIQDRAKTVSTLASILEIKTEEIESILEKAKNMPSYYPVVIKSDTDMDKVTQIHAYKTPWYDETDRYDLRGVEVKMRYARTYDDGNLAPHALGYLREIDQERLKKYNDKLPGRYHMGDFIGIGGVEEAWDNALRGKDGYDQRVVNAMGQQVDWPDIELVHEEPQDGASLHLTIDKDLQGVAKEEMKDKSGAIVAMDPNSGDVLAIFSGPPFDLNKLSYQGGHYWQEISSDPRRVLYNRSIQGVYPPGSTYKIVTAVSAISEGIIDSKSTLYCGGGINYGGRFYQCWRKGGHGNVGLKEALTSSCDTFFYQLGLKAGVDSIARYANLLGMGRVTGIDISGEKTGLIPTSQWKEKRYGVKWQEGENLSIAIGQSYDSVTPIQNALMISIIANGGKKVVPHLVSSVMDANGQSVYIANRVELADALNSEDLETIKEGLKGVVESQTGTAYSALSKYKLKIAGKTGTAQVVAKEVWRSGVAEQKDHAWFVGYAPYDRPEIAVATLVEHGGFGASAAAPVVGKVMQKYFEKKAHK